MVVPLKRPSRVVHFVIEGTLHVSSRGLYIATGIHLSTAMQASDSIISSTGQQSNRPVLNLEALDKVLLVHTGTLLELLVRIARTSMSNPRNRVGRISILLPEVTCAKPGNTNLSHPSGSLKPEIVDYLLGVITIGLSVLSGAIGSVLSPGTLELTGLLTKTTSNWHFYYYNLKSTKP